MSIANQSEKWDTRKLLSVINSSAQSQISLFEDAVKQFGTQMGYQYKLTALGSDKLVFEENGNYYAADHMRLRGNNIKMYNIRKIELFENKKQEIFEDACLGLVDAISEDNTKDIENSFNKIAASRFRSTIASQNGIVKTRDGVIRKIKLSEAVEAPKVDTTGIANRIVKALSDQFTINESTGRYEALLSQDKFDVSKLKAAKVSMPLMAAKKLGIMAEESAKQPKFRSFVKTTAHAIASNKLEEAIKNAAKFLNENQEYCMLTGDKFLVIVEDAMASEGMFNQTLIEHTFTALHRTNVKANQTEIIKIWKKATALAENYEIANIVDALAESKNFAEDYNTFIERVMLEAYGNTEALIGGLTALKDSKKLGAVSADIDKLINDLKEKGDQASEMAATEVLAKVGKGIEDAKNIGDFDSMGLDGAQNVDGKVSQEGVEPTVGNEPVQPSVNKPIEVTVKIDPIQLMKDSQGAQGEAQGSELVAGQGPGDGLGGIPMGDAKDAIADGAFASDAENPEGGPPAPGGHPAPGGPPAPGLSELGAMPQEGEPLPGEEQPPETEDNLKLDDVNTVDYALNEQGPSIQQGGALDASKAADVGKEALRTVGSGTPLDTAKKLSVEIPAVAMKKGANSSTTNAATTAALGAVITNPADKDKAIQTNVEKTQSPISSSVTPKKSLTCSIIQSSTNATLVEYAGVRFIVDNTESPVAILSESGAIQIDLDSHIGKSAVALTEDNGYSVEPFMAWISKNIKNISECNTSTVSVSPDGSISITTTPVSGGSISEVECSDCDERPDCDECPDCDEDPKITIAEPVSQPSMSGIITKTETPSLGIITPPITSPVSQTTPNADPMKQPEVSMRP